MNKSDFINDLIGLLYPISKIERDILAVGIVQLGLGISSIGF